MGSLSRYLFVIILLLTAQNPLWAAPSCQVVADKVVFGDNVDDVNPPTRKMYVAAARSLIETIDSFYGPQSKKDEILGLDWKKMVNQLYGKIGQLRDPKEFLFLISNLLFTFNDAHVSITLPSTLSWTLPFQMSYSISEGQYFINYMETDAMKTVIKKGEMPPLGADLIRVNGEKIEDLQKRIYFNHDANRFSSQAIFARQLTRLREGSGIPLSFMGSPEWTFTFRFQNEKGETVTRDVVMEYQQKGIGLLDLDTILPPAAPEKVETKPNSEKSYIELVKQFPKMDISKLKRIERLVEKSHRLTNLTWKTDRVQPVETPKSNKKVESVGFRYTIGGQEPSFILPKNFKRYKLPTFMNVLSAGGHIFAGTFEYEGKTVGLLRIPSYSPESLNMAPLILRYFITKLQSETDYLILDQRDNPGGYVMYSDWVVKAFTGSYDLNKHMRFRLKPTQSYMRDYAETLAEIESSQDLTELSAQEKADLMKLVREQFEILQKAYRAGEPLSEPVTMLPSAIMVEASLNKFYKESGIQALLESFTQTDLSRPAHYTKPVFMGINELDFSGGDATPAQLQDYGRVKLVGFRTSGAGGPVQEFSERKRTLEIEYSLTTGLMYRMNRQNPYVENFGIQEDELLPMTKDDFLRTAGKKDFLTRFLERVQKYLPKDHL